MMMLMRILEIEEKNSRSRDLSVLGQQRNPVTGGQGGLARRIPRVPGEEIKMFTIPVREQVEDWSRWK